jgi:hypothetical protein
MNRFSDLLGKVCFHHRLGELMAMAHVFRRIHRPVKRLVNNQIKTLQGAGATQRVFEKGVESHKEFMTILIVAHPMSNIVRADCIFSLRGGKNC